MDDRHPVSGEGQDNAEEHLSEAGGPGRVVAARFSRDGAAVALHAEPTQVRERASADERDLSAKRRDERAMLRDEIARQRDQDAASADAKEDVFDRHTLRLEEIRARAKAGRVRAAGDRDRAARDRASAARDRASAADDRTESAFDREQAGTDELTGARRRGVGLEELANEVRRARREGTGLVAAFVDVDALKAVNDSSGHAAGDEVLRAVARGLRQHMRSYDLLVRMGGDEFLCALPKVDIAEAQRRFGDLSEALGDSSGTTVSVGYSELRAEDSNETFVARADADLITLRERTR